jgi:hypothetical protein
MWSEFQALSTLPSFEGLSEHVVSETSVWRSLYDDIEPHNHKLGTPNVFLPVSL